MTLQGTSRIVSIPDYQPDNPIIMEPAHTRDEIEFVTRSWRVSSTAC
jgi:hypothetical protein